MRKKGEENEWYNMCYINIARNWCYINY
jgi:hypothetical protein